MRHAVLGVGGAGGLIAGALARLGEEVVLMRPESLQQYPGQLDVSSRVLGGAGFDCRVCDDELALLWQKLALLAPLALATSALDGPLGEVRNDERFVGCQEEALA